MSGLAGVWNLHGQPVDRDGLRQMAQAAAHRGPDRLQTWVDGEVGLAHVALNTTPESWRERQPCGNRDRTCWIAADARIDNRDELIAACARRNVHLDAPTDVDLILTAYDLWGEDCAAHLLGDFAFVIWDRPRRRLFAARDRLGIRPLVYYRDPAGGWIAWASEIKQLFTHGAVSRTVNDAALGDFLASGCVASLEETAYQHVRRVPPGHTVTIDLAGARLRQYWSLEDVAPIRYRTEDEYAWHFRELLSQAVARHMRSDRPFAVMMSGGLDSTAVASLAAGASRGAGARTTPFTAFSLVFDEIAQCDERPGIEAVAARHRLNTNYVAADGCWPFADEAAGLAGYDEPNPAVQYLLWHATLKAVRAAGCRVVLTGDGGDAVSMETDLAYFNHLRRLRFATFARDVRRYWRLRGKRPPLGIRHGVYLRPLV